MAHSTTELANEEWILDNTWTCDQCNLPVAPLLVDMGPVGKRLVRRQACPKPDCLPYWEREAQVKTDWEEAQDAHDRSARYLRKFPPAAMGERLLEGRWDSWSVLPGTERATERAKAFAAALVAGEAQEPPGLLFWGVPGNGKSTLASLIYQEAANNMQAVAWIHVPSWLERIGGMETADRNKLLDEAGDADLLVLDDLGTQSLTGPRIGWLLRLIDARYRDRRPLVVTQNPSPAQLLQVLTTAARRVAKMADPDGDDGGLADIEGARIVDRLTEACRFVQIKAASYRVFRAEERLKRGE